MGYDYDPVLADTARHYAELDREAIRADFVERRTAEIHAELLASDFEIEALLDQLFANDAISDRVMLACYRGDVGELQSIIRRAALDEAKCRADAELLPRGK